MSIQTQIDRLKGNVSSAFLAVAARGGTYTDTNSDSLAAAIETIPVPSDLSFEIDGNGYLICTYATVSPPPLSINSDGNLIYTYTAD